jgi:hypothetical protein
MWVFILMYLKADFTVFPFAAARIYKIPGFNELMGARKGAFFYGV